MKKFAVVLALTLLSSFALAHDEIPEGTLLALEGTDAIGKFPCALYVMEVDQDTAKVLTSYSHDDDQPAPFTVRAVPGRPGVLAGVGTNGQDQIVLQFASADTIDIRNVKAFNLKWLHGNHFHTNRCLNLAPHEH